MATPRRRESSGGDEGGGANWMDTYGDLVTLLLCFFVLLFSFSSVDAKKWEALVGAFSGTTAIAIPSLSPEQVIEKPIELIARTSGDLIMKDEEESNPQGDGETEGNYDYMNEDAYLNLLKLEENINDFFDQNGLAFDVIPDRDTFTITVRIGSNVFFNSGEAELLPDALPVLDKLTELLAANDSRYVLLTIEGHTDNVPINTSRYPTNWELSALRAVNTLRYVLDKDVIQPGKLSAMGYGEHHPVETNETTEGRASNRRVDFVIQGVTEFDTDTQTGSG
ncbi:MAG: OmpA family protein [Oscillospiraceae bacterium]|jgi:chemotaxis protein MotB|nr:OmpA family protein [Oscillospiraceae bacterium]